MGRRKGGWVNDGDEGDDGDDGWSSRNDKGRMWEEEERWLRNVKMGKKMRL